MASNREERRQMRQRGAGTRKIKDIDFGFSLGFGPTAEGPTSDQVPATEPATEPTSLLIPPPASEPVVAVPSQNQPSLPSPPRNPSTQEQAAQRTPGSARNRLPPRPSTFDIPADEELDIGRSSKRRKIEPPSRISRSSIGTRSKSKSPASSPNGAVINPAVSQRDEQIEIPIRSNVISETTQIPNDIPSIEASSVNPIGPSEHVSEIVDGIDEPLETRDAEQSVPQAEPEPRKPNVTASPPSDTSRGSRKRRGSRTGRLLAAQSTTVPEINSVDSQLPEESSELPPPEQENDTVETAGPKLRRDKRLRSRTPASEQSATAPVEVLVTEKVSPEAVSPDTTLGKGLRGRKRKNRGPTPKASVGSKEPHEPSTKLVEVEVEAEQQDEAAPETLTTSHTEPVDIVNKGKKRAGRPPKKDTQSTETTEEAQRVGKGKRSRRGQRYEKSQEPEAALSPKPEPEPQPQSPPQSPPQPEREHEPVPVLETEAEQDENRELPTGTKRRRGRRPTTQGDKKPTTEPETTEEPSQPARKKPRQQRGDTVPVTVHRLANAESLAGVPLRENSLNEEDSADELSSAQKTELPHRGGVNAADVLGQICRETLEKTITTLKNGIANEANAAKRAEWTLRRKAVEAYGTELEGRLFELSEMLDSNFMLGVQLKKAKRGMLELRNRLDQVRKERQVVALKMDAVRREHAKEEHSRTARSTINRSLHNLDLAIERGRNLASTNDAPLTAGLEFKLRSVAEAVSSTASGAHGGLLNQIKAFNAQLESAAQRLES